MSEQDPKATRVVKIRVEEGRKGVGVNPVIRPAQLSKLIPATQQGPANNPSSTDSQAPTAHPSQSGSGNAPADTPKSE